jgi:hypothetical protein
MSGVKGSRPALNDLMQDTRKNVLMLFYSRNQSKFYQFMVYRRYIFQQIYKLLELLLEMEIK